MKKPLKYVYVFVERTPYFMKWDFVGLDFIVILKLNAKIAVGWLHAL